MEPVRVKETLSLFFRVYLFGVQNEGDGVYNMQCKVSWMDYY